MNLDFNKPKVGKSETAVMCEPIYDEKADTMTIVIVGVSKGWKPSNTTKGNFVVNINQAVMDTAKKLFASLKISLNIICTNQD